MKVSGYEQWDPDTIALLLSGDEIPPADREGLHGATIVLCRRVGELGRNLARVMASPPREEPRALDQLRAKVDAGSVLGDLIRHVAQIKADLDRVRESYGNQEPRSPLAPAEGSGSVGIVDPGPTETLPSCTHEAAPRARVVDQAKLDTLLVAVDMTIATLRERESWSGLSAMLCEAREALR